MTTALIALFLADVVFTPRFAEALHGTRVTFALGPEGERARQERRVVAAPEAEPVRLPAAAPGAYLLTWSGRGVLDGRKEVRVGKERDVELGTVDVKRGRLVDGFVLTPTGEGLAGASVTLEPEGSSLRGRVEARSGAGGYFRVEAPDPDAVYQYSVSARGSRNEEGRLGGESRLIVTLRKAPRIVGRVLGPDGEPVAGAHLTATFVREARELKDGKEHRYVTKRSFGLARSDDEGRFTVERILPERLEIEVRASRLRMGLHHVPPVASDSEADEDVGDIRLQRGRTIQGFVRRRSDGLPVTGARIALSAREDRLTAETDADGKYSLDGVPDEGELWVTARHEGLATALRQLAVKAERLDIEMGRPGALEVRVCGRPDELAETQLNLSRRFGRAESIEASLDAKGTARIDDLEEGDFNLMRTWRLTTGDSYHVLGAPLVTSVNVQEGATATLSFGCDGIPVAGRLRWNGQPIANAYADLATGGPAAAIFKTDATGRFATTVPYAGTYAARVALPSLAGVSLGPPCQVPATGNAACDLELSR